MKKKNYVLSLIGLLAFSLSACGTGGDYNAFPSVQTLDSENIAQMDPNRVYPNSNGKTEFPDSLVSTIGQVYNDRTRAKEDLEAMYKAGIIDQNGTMKDLDLRENGKNVELSELAKRIASGEEVGNITVNGKSATSEQVMKISQVNSALEIAELLESDIDVIDDHAKNLEALLNGIQNGSVDLQSPLKTGTLQLSRNTLNNSNTQDNTDYSLPGTIPSKLSLTEDSESYYGPYVSGSEYNRNYPFLQDYTGNDEYYAGFENAMPKVGETAYVQPNSRRDMFDWSKAIIGIDDQRITPTVTAVLPLKSDDFVQNIIATDAQNNKLTDISKNGIGLEMELPTYGKVNLKYYFNYMFFQYDGDDRNFYGNNILQIGGNREDHGCIRMPVYLVEDESTKRFVAVATRYMAPTATSDIPNLNTLRLYVDPNGNPAIYSSSEYPKPYIASWEDSYVDDLGNHYWDMVNYTNTNMEGLKAAEGDYTKNIIIPGRCLWYFVPPIVRPTPEGYISRPEGSWTQAEHGFIKLKNPENPDFPYVYPNDIDHPELQYDVELMVTEQLYESYSKAEAKDDSWVAPIYLGDNDLRIALRISDRRNFSRAPDGQMFGLIRWVDDGLNGYETLTPEDFTVETTCNDGLYILTITPKKVTSPEEHYTLHSNRAMLGLLRFGSGHYYLGIPIHMRVCEADPFLSVPKSSQIRQTTEGLKLCSELYERHVLGYNNSVVNLRYDDCNPFGLLAGDFEDFNKISTEPQKHVGSKMMLSEFNNLGQLLDGFLGQFDLPNDGTEFVPSLGDEDLNRYNTFYNKAMEIYDTYSLVSFAKNTNHDLSKSALLGLSNPFTMTFGNIVNPESVDLQAAMAKLFGFASKTEFQKYAKDLGEIIKTKGVNGAIAEGTLPSENVRAIYPIAIKNSHTSPVLAYLFVDNSYHVSIWVNDIDAALSAINFDANHYSNSAINNDLYCLKALFTSGVGGVEITFSSNLAQHNKIDTLYVAKLYKVSGIDRNNLNTLPENAQPINIEGWGVIPASASDLVSHIVVPSTAFDGPGAYAVTINADYSDGTTETPQTFSVIVYIEVKSAPLKIHFEKLASDYFDQDNIPEIKYNVTSAVESAQIKYTIQGSGDEVSEMKDAASGVIPFTPDDFDGLKKVYTITVYGKNYEEQPWSVDSMMVTIYNKDVLELLIKDVAFGEVGGSTGGQVGEGTEKVGSSIEIDNNPKIIDLLDKTGDGKGITISGYDLNALRNDINLQRIISINYGSSVLGTISDRMQWLVKDANGQNSSAISLYNKEGGAYVALKSYTSYIPTTDFLIVATDDRGEDAPVTITATHASSGSTRSVEVTVKTLKDKLYLFRFLPKAKTYVHYFNGKGVERELYSNEQGELAIYEPDGIASDIDTLSHVGQETYAGTIRNKDLVSGEKDVIALQTYPCNNLTLEPISNQTITFLKPDGKPYSGSATLRAGIYKKGVDGVYYPDYVYCPDYGVRTTDETDTPQILRDDIDVTVKDGKTTLYYDPTQLAADWGLYFGIRYVYEYRIDGYQPGYAIIDPFSENPADFIINLQKVKGKASDPQITRQVYQQYLNGTTKTSYSRNVIDSTVNIGISANLPKAVLYTDIALPGESVNVDQTTKYSSYEGDDVLKFAFYTAGGKKLTGQNDLADNAKATQITDLGQLDSATYFVFPFSKVPMLRSTYVMTNTDMKSDGIDDTANHPTSRIKAVFTRGSLNVASINMPFGVTNVANQPSITSKDGGAQSVGKEVRDALRETADLGAIFQSINVNDMIKKGFVFLSNLKGIGGDNFIDLMILPTQDPANFRIIAFVGKSQRGGDDDGDGVSYNVNANDLAEDYGKFIEEANKLSKDKDDDDDDDNELELNFYGTIVLDARIGIADGKWNIAFRGGNVGTNVKLKYEWGQTFFCGPVPAFISFELGFHADLEVSFGNKDSARAMLLDASLGVSMEAFAGLGFDLSLVALQLGIYGQIGANLDYLLLTPSNAAPSAGSKLTISGEIGIKLKVKILFVSYSKTFASTGFNWTKKWNRYDQILDYWNDQGYGQLFGVTRSGRAYQMLLFADGNAAVAIDGGAELESRDYLELQERAWNNGVNGGMRLLKSANPLTNVLSNAYPHSHPAFTDDGEMFVYISDNDNAKAVESVASYAVSNGSGFDDKGRIDTSEDNILADLDVVASGTKDNAFAAWVKQVEMPEMERNASISNDDLGMMFNATEVYASTYNGSSWTTTRLTDNFVADMSPAIASYGNKAIVAWRSMYASSMSSSEDITAVFDMENNINYRIYNGSEWTEAKVAYNGSAGSVNAIDCAMLKDGTALLTYTVRTGKDVTSTETFYTVIKADGTILTTGRLTNDNFTDTNAQVTAVNDGKGYFVIGWYSEHSAGEGLTSDYDEDGNASSKEAVAHDIRLARIHANGSYDADFPESIGGTTSSDISADFRFSAPIENADLTNIAIVWSQRKVSDVPDDAGKYQLQAVRFYELNDSIGFTAPTNIAETTKNYTIDHFDVYTDTDGAVHAIILGSDYNNIQGIKVYDSIDLDAAARNNVSDNSDAPSNLNILDGEAISSIKLATATFPEISADVVAQTNILDVVPGLTSTIQFVVTNTGSDTLSEIKATIASTSKTFTVNLLPNRSTTLLMDYDIPAGAVNDVNYSLEAKGIEIGSGTLTLNRPDIGISGVSIKREESGQRDIQVFLSNGTDIPLAGSGKTVKLAFYKDAFYEKMIGEPITIPEEDYASIDRGNYFLMHTISVSDLYAGGGEIPDGGINVYVRAYVEGSEEPITSNNEGFVRIESLVERNEGAKLAKDTRLEENDGAYTVTAEIRNHSMLDVNIGIPVAILRDAEGNIIARKNIQDTELEIGKESVVDDLSVTFLASEINGTPVQAEVKNIVLVHFDVNGGTGKYDDVYTDLDGHIDIPDNDPLVPNNNPLLFFRGWYDSPSGGNLVTDDSVIDVKTTLYARFTEHEHVYEYSLEDDGTTIKAVCVSTADDICPLEEVGRTASLTIHAPERSVDGYGMPEATIIGATNVFGTPEIVYYVQNEDGSRGKALTKAPVDAGKYWAEFTIEIGKDSVTAHVAYKIPHIEGVTANNAQIPNFVKVSDASALNNLGQCSALEAYAWISANADKLNLTSYDKCSIVVFNKQYMPRPENVSKEDWPYDENKEYAVCFEYRGQWMVRNYLLDDLTNFLTDDRYSVYIKGADSTSVFGDVNFEKVTTSEELSAVSCTENDALIWIVANLKDYPRAIVVFSGDNDYYNFLSYDNDRGRINTEQDDSYCLFQTAENEQKQIFIARPSDVLNPYKTYTITYDANGGNGEIAPGTFYVKSDITIANGNELSKTNLVFDCWNTASDGSGDSYKPGDRLELLNNITLYAQYKHDHHWNIIYDESKRTFTASCDTEGCDITISPTLELKADGKTYDGKAVVSYVCSGTWTEENGLSMPSIIYYVGGKRAIEAKNAGKYTTLVTLGSQTITLDEFTIAPRPIVVKADDKEMHEGEDEPELTVSYEPTSAAESGLVDGDILDFTITRQEGDVEGTYAITVKMGDNPNYDVLDVRNGTFTILAPLGEVQTIEANDVTARYGDTGVKIDAKITKGDGSLSYIVKSGDAVTVDENGNLTILKVGTAVITVVASQTATSAKTTKNINVTIQLGTMEVSANDVVASVDGEVHGINVTVNKPASGYVIHYGLTEGTYDLTASPTLTEAGTLTVYYRVSADNYETVTGSVTLTLLSHSHNFTYTVGSSDKANTITATCAGNDCPLPEHQAVLVINAPSGDLVYNGAAHLATITDEYGIAGEAKIVYAVKGTDGSFAPLSESSPVNAGVYRASITIGEGENAVTAYVDYEIKPAKITNASVEPVGILVYDGSAQTPIVNGNANTVNGEKATFTYSRSQDGEYGELPTFTNVSDAGTIYFKASAPNHEDAYGSFEIVMHKSTQEAPSAPTLSRASGNTITLVAKEGYEYSRDGINWQDSATFTGLSKNSEYTFYQRLKETDNQYASPSSASINFFTTNHSHEWVNFVVTGNTITATCADSDGGHGDEKDATMTIVAPTLNVYGGTGNANATVNNEIDDIVIPTIVYKQGDTVLSSAPTGAGTYTAFITLKGEDIGQDADITASVTYTIAKKVLTVSANPNNIIYGDAPTGAGVIYEGFLPGEDESVLGGTLDYTFSYEQYDDVGTYTITPKNLESDNYSFNYVSGVLTVSPKEVTVTIDKKTSHYGDEPVALTGSSEGIFASDENVYSLTSEVSKTSNIGSYDIVGTDISDNYVVTFVGEEDAYIVTRRPITAKAEDKTIKSGEQIPALTLTVNEELSAEALALIKENINLACNGNVSAVGKYPITLSFKEGVTSESILDNYVVTLEEGNLYVLTSVLTDDSNDTATGVEILLENENEAFDYNVSVSIDVTTPAEATGSSLDYSQISSQYVDRRSEISEVYSITLYRTEIVDGVEKMVEVQPSDLKEGLNLIIKIEIPEYLVGRNFRILHIHSQNDIEYVDASNLQIKDGYVYVKVNRLSDFAFVNLKASEEMNHGGFCLGWLTLIFDILLAAYFVVYMILKRKKLLGIIGLGTSGAVTIFAVIVLILHICYESIIGLVLSVLLLILFFVFFLLSKKGNKSEENKIAASLEDNGSVAKKESENKLDEPTKENSLKAEETINKPVVEEKAIEEVISSTDIDESKHGYKKSFLARMSQSNEKNKEYYSILKNEGMAYNGAKSRLSWSNDSIVVGRKQVVKFSLRGTTLCAYFALNPDDFDSNKINVEKAQAAKYKNAPCMLRIKNKGDVTKAKRLIARSAKSQGVNKGELPDVDYRMPFESNEDLVKKGLAKEKKAR